MLKTTNGYLEEYYHQAREGEVVIGQELMMELENLISDIDDDRFIYDTKQADLRMEFMENCVRLDKSPYYNQPMKLMLWQKAFLSAVYGFKMADTGFDRFKKIILLIARKNCKSSTSSALALAELLVGPDGADIVASSNDDPQASIVYDSIDMMRSLVDPEDLDTRRTVRFILNKNNNSKIFKLSDRTKNKEGRNIDFAIIDETHEMKDNVISKSIEQSQSLKDNPKMINITTEGFVVDGFLDEELKKARAVIMREDPDDIAGMRLLPWLYTQDSEQEVWYGNRENRLWMKSNPTLGVIKKWEYLEEQVAIAKKNKADRVFVLSKDFNIKQNSVEAWLNLEDYDYECAYDLEDFRGAIALGGVDLSETTDLTCAKIMLQKAGDSKKYIHSMYFMPESKLETSPDIAYGARYKDWAEQGLITITPGNDLDLAIVADWFYKLYTDYGIRLWKCGYDQRFAKDWLNRMEDYGWTKPDDVEMILQTAPSLTNAIKLAENDFKSQILCYNNNEVDKWCFKNAGIKIDDRGQCLLTKSERGKRIDGAAALIVLYEMERRWRSQWNAMCR